MQFGYRDEFAKVHQTLEREERHKKREAERAAKEAEAQREREAKEAQRPAKEDKKAARDAEAQHERASKEAKRAVQHEREHEKRELQVRLIRMRGEQELKKLRLKAQLRAETGGMRYGLV